MLRKAFIAIIVSSFYIIIFLFNPAYSNAQSENEKAILHYNEAIDHFQARNFEEAIKSYGKAIKEDPEYTNAYYNRANLLMRLEKYEKALSDYTSVLRLDPEIPKAWLYKGIAEQLLKNDRSAMKSFNKALQLDSSMEDAWERIALIQLKHENFESAIEGFSKALEINGSNANHYYNRAAAYYSLKNYDASIRDFSTALSIKEDKDWYKARGKAYLAKGMGDEALADFTKSDFREQKDTQLSKLLVIHFLEKGDTAKTIAELHHLLMINTADQEMRNLRAYLSMQKAEYHQAIEDYTKLIEQFPQESNYLLNRGIARVLLEYHTEALEDFNAVISLKPDYAEAFFNRSGVYVSLGEQEKACEDMRQSAKLGYTDAFDHIRSLCRQ